MANEVGWHSIRNKGGYSGWRSPSNSNTFALLVPQFWPNNKRSGLRQEKDVLLKPFYFTTFLSACKAESFWTPKIFPGNTHGEALNWGQDTAVLASWCHTIRESCRTFLPHFQFLTAISSDFSTWRENEEARGPNDSFCSDGRNFNVPCRPGLKCPCSPTPLQAALPGYGGQMWVSLAKCFVMVLHMVGMKG